MESVHHDVQVVRLHSVHQRDGLLEVADTGPGQELHVILQAVLLGHLGDLGHLIDVVGLVPGPDAAQHVGGAQLGCLLKRGVILVDVQVGADAGQLDVHHGHVVLLQSLAGLLEQLGVLVEQELRLSGQVHRDGAQADEVIPRLLGDADLVHRGGTGDGQIGQRKLSGHTAFLRILISYCIRSRRGRFPAFELEAAGTSVPPARPGRHADGCHKNKQSRRQT